MNLANLDCAINAKEERVESGAEKKNGVGERLEKMGWKKGVESRWKIK